LLRFEVLDGGNGASQANTLETWEMYSCFISQDDYGNMHYNTNDTGQIALTIRFDNALQTPVGTGIGVAVQRTIGSIITNVTGGR